MKKQTQNKPNQSQSSFLPTCFGWDFINQTVKAADDIWWIEVIIDS